jgi:amino acid transporter
MNLANVAESSPVAGILSTIIISILFVLSVAGLGFLIIFAFIGFIQVFAYFAVAMYDWVFPITNLFGALT